MLVGCDCFAGGAFEGNFIFSESSLDRLCSLTLSVQVPKILVYMHQHNLSNSLSLGDSERQDQYRETFSYPGFLKELRIPDPSIPRSLKEALSLDFIDEWGPLLCTQELLCLLVQTR